MAELVRPATSIPVAVRGLNEAEDIFKEMSSGFHQGHGE
jgi:hypothetical protein